MMDFAKFECAIGEWIMHCLCFDSQQIFWRAQNQPQPHYPFISLFKTNIVPVGQDELRQLQDLSLPVGQQTVVATVSSHNITLNIEAYADDEHGGQNPNKNAFALLAKLMGSMSHSKTLDYFCDAGAVFLQEQNVVTDISSIINSKYVSRATVDLRFRVLCYNVHDDQDLSFIEDVRFVSNCPSLRPIDITITGDKEI